MKKETFKEVGKLFLDFTKIIFAVAILTPFIKDGNVQIITILPAFLTGVIGVYLINKGINDE